jgi:prepilin-type N-terminal cleavage/methylation domain-containing protein
MAMKFSFVPRLRPRRLTATRGMTLVEMLVALTVTLIMMGAVITVFGFIGETVTDSRSIIETNDRLRSAAHRLREDLGSVTATMMPPLRPESGAGYFEIIEGPLRAYPTDTATKSFSSANRDAIRGDYDDALFFTIRSSGDPFRGKNANNPTPLESTTAEVAWYLRPGLVQGGVQTYVLCRKLMLIVPELPANIPLNPAFYTNYDVSARRVSANNANAVANTLGDLTKRENRFARQNTFPYALLDLPVLPSAPAPLSTFEEMGLGRAGEDVVLTNLLGMDVQVWDPQAPLKKWQGQDVILTPSDPAYRDTQSAKGYPTDNNPTRGAYVDLGLMRDRNPPGSVFMGSPQQKSGLSVGFNYTTYDTWSFHYEHDGVRQSTATITPNTLIDAGTNGIDDNSTIPANVGIDDISERETMPPYPLPLRGIRVTLRVYEPSSRQVREVTVVESFVPD